MFFKTSCPCQISNLTKTSVTHIYQHCLAQSELFCCIFTLEKQNSPICYEILVKESMFCVIRVQVQLCKHTSSPWTVLTVLYLSIYDERGGEHFLCQLHQTLQDSHCTGGLCYWEKSIMTRSLCFQKVVCVCLSASQSEELGKKKIDFVVSLKRQLYFVWLNHFFPVKLHCLFVPVCLYG